MALTRRIIYGVHSATPYNIDDRTFYGILHILQGSAFNMSGAVNQLRGGSNRFAWAVEDGDIDASVDLNCSEYPDFLFELFLGKGVTTVSAEASGNASSIANVSGTTVVSAAGLLATITVDTAADLKFGKYIIKATGTGAADIFHSTDLDNTRGTDASDFDNNNLLIEQISGVGSGSTHALSEHGITLTAGASAGAMSSGDTAEFSIRPVTTGSNMTVTGGGLSDVFPSFGVLLYAAQRGNGEMFEIDVFNLKGIGVSLGGTPKEFGSWNVNAIASYDSSRSGVFSLRHVRP